MTIKEQLTQLYRERSKDFKHIIETFPEDDLAGPFLMSPNELYQHQPIRLLIVGQQTNGWSYDFDDIGKQMANYEEFNLGIYYYSSPFWNITRKLELALGNVEYSCAWTNLNKYDLDSKRPFGNFEKEISKFDSILIDEIKILKPDACIFFTGPSFDLRIKSLFNGIVFEKIENWDMKQLCRIIHEILPELTFRTHHPKSLRIRYLEEKFIEYIRMLV
ncbi:MAG: hypothetical protein NTV01_20485 [Bacteroidia bacterium]|nr:hypothetical protein [Bacteroidia bacterium]